MPELKAANHLLVSLFYWAGGEGRVSWNPKFWEPLITSPQGFSSPLLRVQRFLECWATFDNKLWIHLPSKWSVFSVCTCLLSQLSCVQLFVIPWTVYCQALLSMGFSGQEHWSRLPCPPPGESSWSTVWISVSYIADRFLTHQATWVACVRIVKE